MTSTDETLAVISLLEAQSAFTGWKFFGNVEEPPPPYTPADGVGVCLKVRGGNDGDPIVLMHPSFQFKVYAKDEVVCQAAARTLHDNFNEKYSIDILAVNRETLPVLLREPTAREWIYALVFYKVMLRHLN